MRTALIAVVALLVLAVALPATACPVCYGEAEGPVIEGTRWSVAFLGALVYLVLGGGAGMVVVQRRRALRRMEETESEEDLRRGLRLVPDAEPGERDAD